MLGHASYTMTPNFKVKHQVNPTSCKQFNYDVNEFYLCFGRLEARFFEVKKEKWKVPSLKSPQPLCFKHLYYINHSQWKPSLRFPCLFFCWYNRRFYRNVLENCAVEHPLLFASYLCSLKRIRKMMKRYLARTKTELLLPIVSSSIPLSKLFKRRRIKRWNEKLSFVAL